MKDDAIIRLSISKFIIMTIVIITSNKQQQMTLE